MLYSSLDGREGPSVVLCGDARSVAVSGRLHPYNLIKFSLPQAIPIHCAMHGCNLLPQVVRRAIGIYFCFASSMLLWHSWHLGRRGATKSGK